MTNQNNRLGTWLMVTATLVFAAQDGISRHLGSHYPVFSIVMVRYWAFVVFGIYLLRRGADTAPVAGGVIFGSARPVWQMVRGLLLVSQICVMMLAFVKLGLIESHAVFTSSPLLVAALSGPVLGEKVGWRRWAAIGVGCVGVLIILQPGLTVFSPYALLPLFAAFLYALYGLLTRYVGRTDSSAVSFFWMGLVGALSLTVPGLWLWQPMTGADSLWLATLCCTGILGHWLLIRCYEVAEASAVQPLAYLQIAYISIFGITIFGEVLRWNVVIGVAIVVSAGLFTLWRQRLRARQAPTDPTVLP